MLSTVTDQGFDFGCVQPLASLLSKGEKLSGIVAGCQQGSDVQKVQNSVGCARMTTKSSAEASWGQEVEGEAGLSCRAWQDCVRHSAALREGSPCPTWARAAPGLCWQWPPTPCASRVMALAKITI